MRRPLMLVVLLFSLVAAAAAAPGAPVQYALTFYKPVQVIGIYGPTSVTRVEGTIGGVEVYGEYDSEHWVVTPAVIPTVTFASGTLTCAASTCSFVITELLDRTMTMHAASFTYDRRISGVVPIFATKSEWVSAVTRWADDHRVKPDLKAKIVAQAAGGGTPLR